MYCVTIRAQIVFDPLVVMPSVLSRISAPQLLAGIAVGVGVGALVGGGKSQPEPALDEDAAEVLEAKNAAAAREAARRARAAEVERDQARREIEALRAGKQAPEGAGDLAALKKERDELEALRKEAVLHADNLEKQEAALRKEMEGMASERDTAVAQSEEAQRRVASLKEEQASLQKELDASRQKRRELLTNLSRSMGDISAK